MITRQLVRFGLVGLFTNMLLYILYLALTSLGVGYLLSVVVSYAGGILISFVSNKSWTFKYSGSGRTAFARYFSAYLAGLGLNLLILYILVDRFGLPHQLCQGFLILLFAASFFLLQKWWIFPAEKSATNSGQPTE